MAGYPPQQQYAAVHQAPHVTPYHVPSYLVHHQYPSHLPPSDRLHEGYAPSQSQPQPQPPPQVQSQQGLAVAGGNSGPSKVSLAQSSQHNMHHSHPAPPLDRAPAAYDSHRNQSVRPSSHPQPQAAPAPHAGPSIARQHHYGSNTPASQQQQHSSQVAAHHTAAAVGHNHSLSAAASHSQNHVHSHHPHGQHVHANYALPMHPHEYEQQHAPPPLVAHHSGAPRMPNQHIPAAGQNGVGSNVKRSGGGARDKEKEAAAPLRGPGGGGAATKGGAGVKRSGQEKQSGAGGKQTTGGTSAAADKANASMHAAANDEPLQESKKIRKRKEVVDRIHRVHWDTLENREILYHDLQHKLSVESTTLLLWPSNSRPYLMALHRLNLERDAQLRQSALLHAHQVESARMAYDQETQKVEDEARNSKKQVREKLLAAVEDRRRRLREDKESGEGMADTLLDPSTRHATRKLRNKATGSSKRGADVDANLAARVAGTNTNGTLGNGSLLGLLLSGGVNGAGTDGASTPRGGESNSFLGGLTSMAEFNQLSGVQGTIAALPPSNFDSVSNNAVSLLHLQGVGGGMGDSSYMSGTRIALQDRLKGKKKPGGKSSLANAGLSTGGAAIGGSAATNGHAVNASGADDDEDGANGSNSRTVAAAAAAAVAAASLAIGTGRTRWEQGKSVGQLTSAKDIEIESDLISIRKMGNKRRRR